MSPTCGIVWTRVWPCFRGGRGLEAEIMSSPSDTLLFPAPALLSQKASSSVSCLRNAHLEADHSAHPSTCSTWEGGCAPRTIHYCPQPCPVLSHTLPSQILPDTALLSPQTLSCGTGSHPHPPGAPCKLQAATFLPCIHFPSSRTRQKPLASCSPSTILVCSDMKHRHLLLSL